MSQAQGTSPDIGRLLYAASEQCADMAYCSGFMAPDPFLWYEIGDRRGMIVSALEVGRARQQAASGMQIRSVAQAVNAWSLPSPRPAPEMVIGALSRESSVDHWEVPATFPLDLARKLEARGLALTVAEPFAPGRACKTAREQGYVREGVRVAEAGLARALAVLRDAVIGRDGRLHWQGSPLTSAALRGEIDATIARRGGTASHTIVACGVHGADPHDVGSGALVADTPIVIDIFPRMDATGYWGDLTRTVVKGTAAEPVRRAYAAVLAAQEAAFQVIGPDCLASEAHRVAAEALEQAGFSTDATAVPPRGFFHGLGHGLGLEIHEAPRVNQDSGHRLRPGEVITVEPGLYYPEWGGIRLEDVVIINDGGFENLTVIPKILEL